VPIDKRLVELALGLLAPPPEDEDWLRLYGIEHVTIRHTTREAIMCIYYRDPKDPKRSMFFYLIGGGQIRNVENVEWGQIDGEALDRWTKKRRNQGDYGIETHEADAAVSWDNTRTLPVLDWLKMWRYHKLGDWDMPKWLQRAKVVK
jgi:hypothetical protein